MKTTKTIAAVLAVFLVAVLFMGAASAAPVSGTTVYVYQYNGSLDGAATNYYLYQSGYAVGTVTTDAAGTFIGDGITEGLYGDNTTAANCTTFFTLKYPALTLAAYKAGTGTSIIGSSIVKEQKIDFSVSGTNNLIYGLKFTTPAGGSTTVFGQDALSAPLDFKEIGSTFTTSDLSNIDISNVAAGEWTVKAAFKTGTVTTKMTETTPSKYLDSPSIKFTIGSPVSDSISINKESIIRGSSILVTVTGTPNTYVKVTINDAGFTLLDGQSNVTGLPTTGYLTNFTVGLSSSGTKTVQLNTNSSSADTTYTLSTDQTPSQKAKVTVVAGTVTVTPGQDSYYLGNDITLSGTNTETDVVYLYIKGANKKLTELVSTDVKSDDTWTKTLTLPNTFDAGTYTFYASANQFVGTSGVNLTINDDTDTYTSVSVALKQPFLTATAASSTVAQGDKIKITGTAEAASQVMYYIFGTNKFVTGTISVESDGSYSKEIPTDNLATGQYFVVIQHPMYDTVFNIGPIDINAANGNYNIVQNTTGKFDVMPYTILFNTLERQSANAAEALCQALDSQNIDDIYVKLTFIVAQPTLTMSPVSDVTKGSALKVSGTTNLKAGTVVTIDVLSTAFTAVDKSTVSSASFITLTTKVVKGADGVNTWEVTFDTTGLNVDTYTIQATTDNQLSTSTTVKVLEATKTPTATATATKTATATATATPTPQSPGFGAFLALAGLGAVAVLVLRRD